MPRARLCVWALVLLAAPPARGQQVRFGDDPSLGERLRVGVAREYSADRIVVGSGRIDTLDAVVHADGTTVTVVGPDGREIRYPGRHALLAGRLTDLDAEWLTLDLGDGRPDVRVPRTAIERLEVSLGAPDPARSALKGAVLPGLPLGAAGFYLTAFRNFLCDYDCHPAYEAWIGAAIGVAIGAGIRVALEGERWREVSVSVAPQPGHGVSGAVSLRF